MELLNVPFSLPLLIMRQQRNLLTPCGWHFGLYTTVILTDKYRLSLPVA